MHELGAVFLQQCFAVLLAKYICKKTQWQNSNLVCAANWVFAGPASFRSWRGWHGSKMAGWGLLTVNNR